MILCYIFYITHTLRRNSLMVVEGEFDGLVLTVKILKDLSDPKIRELRERLHDRLIHLFVNYKEEEDEIIINVW